MSKKKHSEHHGGAWKVAYADFVTAMMALFMVLWIIGQKEEVLKATADYFKDPASYNENLFSIEHHSGEGAMGNDGTGVSKLSKSMLQQLVDTIYNNLNINKEDKNRAIDIIIMPDGLKMLVYDLKETKLFDDNKIITQWFDMLLQSLAWIFDKHSAYFDILIYSAENSIKANVERIQKELRKQKNTSENFCWCNMQSIGKQIYKTLVHYGFSLNKLLNITSTSKIPTSARYKDIDIVEFYLHMDTINI